MKETNISDKRLMQESLIPSVGMKYGCLLVQDEGTEYLHLIDQRISNIKAERAAFIQAIQENKLVQKDRYGWNGGQMVITTAFVYNPDSFEIDRDSINENDFDEAVSKCIKAKETRHYKCCCKKCGKIRYYTAETLQSQPTVCCKPIYCSSKHTYSTKAQNATYRKKIKYKNNESVCLVTTRDAVIPSDEYCGYWNEKKRKELIKQADKNAKVIAAIPRRQAKNYEVDYVGTKYESFEILECVDYSRESVPIPYYNQRHQKKYRDIIVYKEYRCKCYLCGKEKLITCDKFGIYPPNPHGYRAYNGYWSEVHCDCHKISSFQWIVNDILMKHGINYQVEVPADGVYGVDDKTLLRFDFAVYKENELVAFIECQGEQHYRPVEDFGGEYRFAIQQRNDEEKRKYAKKLNVKLIEISYKDKQYEKVQSILMSQNIF